MKKLVSAGTTLIVSQPAAQKLWRHDPWQQHGDEHGRISFDICPSGNRVFWFEDGLKDGSFWYYPFLFGDPTQTLNFFTWVQTNGVGPDGMVGFAGETFNYVWRPKVFGKFNEDDFITWFYAH